MAIRTLSVCDFCGVEKDGEMGLVFDGQHVDICGSCHVSVTVNDVVQFIKARHERWELAKRRESRDFWEQFAKPEKAAFELERVEEQAARLGFNKRTSGELSFWLKRYVDELEERSL